MDKDEVISTLVSIRMQIAMLKMKEASLYTQLDLAMPRVTPVKVKVVKRSRQKHYKQGSKKHRELMSAKMKETWAKYTSEQRAERIQKIREGFRNVK